MAMPDRPINVLFLCTGNSARSILAEALLNNAGGGRILGHSAGSAPRGEVHPAALSLLRQHGVLTEGLRSKSWDEFTAPGAPVMDFVITLCDSAAKEICPVWPGSPITANWELPDPAAPAADGTSLELFRRVFTTLERRIGMLGSVNLRGFDRARLEELMVDIRELVPFEND